jgi:type II secretory pathway pseudopilin PulG
MHSKINKSDYQMNRGFTLIEAFVAIAVLMIAIVGPLALFSRAIGDATSVKNQMIAYYLAQEGLELAINKLDSNRTTEEGVMVTKKKNEWLKGLESCDNAYCIIYYDISSSDSGVLAEGNDNRKLRIDKNLNPPNPLYNYNEYNEIGQQTNQTIFSRTVRIESKGAGGITQVGDTTLNGNGDDSYLSELEITSEVKYKEKGVDKTVTLKTIISN